MIPRLSTSFLVYIYVLSGSLLGILTRAQPLKGSNVTKVEKGKYPYVVSIVQKNNRSKVEEMHICTGMLVTSRFVVTAAHCLDGVKEIEIIVGSVNLRKGKRYEPSFWVTYNQWAESKINISQSIAHDIAMIKLLNVVRDNVAEPAVLSFQRSNDLKNEQVTLIGWGLTNWSPDRPPKYLHEVGVKVVLNVICEQNLFVHFKIILSPSLGDKYLCTRGEGSAFLAEGDSGGPVLWKKSVVAINKGPCPSNGISDLSKGVDNNYMFNTHISLHFYKDFISDVVINY